MHKDVFNILMADDDPDDRLITRLALEKCKFKSNFLSVSDGSQLIDYLKRRGKYNDEKEYPKPRLILLDIHMPKKNGLEALREIKGDDNLRHIPVIILSSSQRKDDILSSYRFGVNSYINKPASFDLFVEEMKIIGKYWLDIARTP